MLPKKIRNANSLSTNHYKIRRIQYSNDPENGNIDYSLHSFLTAILGTEKFTFFRNREVYILLGATIVLYLTYIFIKRAYLNACNIYATQYLCSSATKNKK
jgi:hypothetical protein